MDNGEKGLFAFLLGIVGISLLVQLFIYFVVFMVVADFFDWGIAITDKL